MSALVEGIDVHRSFGATPALRGVDLDVDSGEIVAIMGPSGSGKSTLLHCLAGILQPDDGEVRFAGRRVDDLSEHDRTVLRPRTFFDEGAGGRHLAVLSARSSRERTKVTDQSGATLARYKPRTTGSGFTMA